MSDPLSVWFEDKLREQLAPVIAWLENLKRKIEAELHLLRHGHHHVHRIVLGRPTFTNLQGVPIMPAFSLGLDQIATFPITLTNAAGGLDPAQAGDVFTCVSADPTNLQAVIAADANGAPTLVVNWMHSVTPMLTSVGVSISDSAGNTSDTAEAFDMVAPAFIPDVIGIDATHVVITPQAVPV